MTCAPGDCGHTAGDAVSKKLADWAADSVTVQEDDTGKRTTFQVSAVVGPEVEQDDACAQMLADLQQAFWSDTNVLFFAYGQTGHGRLFAASICIDELLQDEVPDRWQFFHCRSPVLGCVNQSESVPCPYGLQCKCGHHLVQRTPIMRSEAAPAE